MRPLLLIADTPFTVSCELTTAQRDAILLAHGGASTGYALHLSAGKLIWAIRHGKTITTAQTDYPADNQPHRITPTLTKKANSPSSSIKTPPSPRIAPASSARSPKKTSASATTTKSPWRLTRRRGSLRGRS